SAWPAVSPSPGTTLKTPSGMPASAASSASRSVESEVSSAGLITSELPAVSEGAAFQAAIISGKFQGRTAPTTPIGSRMIMPSASRPVGAIESYSLSAASAYQRNAVIDSGRSASPQSVIGLPASSESSSASSSAFSSINSARRSITALRSAGERRDQRPSENARRAAVTARSISSESPAATSARSRPVAGSSVANRSPLSAGRKAPSMNASVRNVGRAAMTTTPPRPASGRRMIRAAVGSARPGHQSLAIEHRRYPPPADDVGHEHCDREPDRERRAWRDHVERDERRHDDRGDAPEERELLGDAHVGRPRRDRDTDPHE